MALRGARWDPRRRAESRAASHVNRVRMYVFVMVCSLIVPAAGGPRPTPSRAALYPSPRQLSVTPPGGKRARMLNRNAA